ncbi:MAG: superoxide dismutase family protein [Wenzhouxiangellaceae bacterium]|nr:superoxide dismutase family protein [Wenzhouxiangellaceae bacterium]
MNRISLLTRPTVAATLLALAAATVADDHVVNSTFINNAGDEVGSLNLTQGPHGLIVRIELDGLPPGPKAIHIHHTGTCEDHAAGFKASGGHVNPDASQHGLLNPDGPGAGDFPNFYVHDNGYAWAEMFNARLSLDGSIGPALLDENGSAMVIHENVDDHMTQPIGGAGARIACAVIKGG